MHCLSKSVLVSLSLVAAVVASPIEKRNTFTVSQVQASRQVSNPGPSAYAQALAKHGIKVPANVKAAAGDVTATPTAQDASYICPVNIGGQTLNLDFDTGSSDLWVFSTELSAADQQGHSVFNPSKSRTFKKLSGATWSISYGDGSSASGDVGKDTVSVGATSVPGQAVELAKTISSEFEQTPGDGLLGLGFSSINQVMPTQQSVFWQTANLQDPVFTADLKKAAPGSYDFGFIDNSKYTGSIAYTPVDNSQGVWGFTADSYSIGSSSQKLRARQDGGDGSDGGSITGIADTGTTLLLLDDSVVSDYYSSVSSAQNNQQQGGYTFDCSAQLPDFTFTVGGYNAVIPGSLINFAPISDGSSTCFGGLQSNQGAGFSIFGDVMFKSQFVVFDTSVPQLGFAAKAS